MHPIPLASLPADQRDYQLYRAGNGLFCLLIHDVHASQATAVYQVAAGSHAEPDDLPGLAHLLEHMLFMGSQRWPAPGSFPARVAEWGGRFNASTAPYATRFFCSVSPQGLQPCLAQLTDMLAAPLFAPQQVEQERRVIDAEFQTRLADDDIHAQAVLATQVQPEHPLSRFTAGNAQTLAGDAAALSERLSQWHAIHYRAGSMALVLHGPQSPEQLLALAQDSADQLLAGRAPEPFALPLFAPGQLPRQVDWQGRSSQAQTVLLYPLRECDVHGAAAHWLGEWLNSPSPAGALGYLRERGLLDELHASLEADVGGQALLRLELHSAHAEPEQVLAGLDGWVQAMRSRDPAEWPQAARRALAQTAFDLGPQGDLLDSCRRYAERLLTLPAEQVLDVPGVALPTLGLADWQQLLSQLAPSNRLLLQRLPRLLGGELCAHTSTRWQARALRSSPAPTANLAGRLGPCLGPLAEAPKGLRWSSVAPGLRLHRFAPSSGALRTRLAWCWTDKAATLAERRWLQACWSLQSEALEQWGARVGVRLQWSLAPGQVVLDVSGPQRLLPSFVRELLSQLQAPPAASQLALIERRSRRWLQDEQDALPAWRLLQTLEQECANRALRLRDPLALWQGLCAQAQILWLKPDGWSEGEGSQLAKLLLNLCPSLLQPFVWRCPLSQLQPGQLQVSEVSSKHTDRAQLLYLPAEDDSLQAAACWRLLHHRLADPFFAELRTRQQLGYWVVARLHRRAGRPGLLLLVQSPDRSHRCIESAVDVFLDQSLQGLGRLSADQLQSQAVHLAQLLEQQRQHPQQGFEAHWEDCLWQREDQLAAEQQALLDLTAAHWSAFVSRLPHSARWRLLSRQAGAD
ncbi:insulinase family protein [Halopseudomonas maritima]|uniref:insulinase family protein n=1 Tax=Halopseudomonas maritima TaxID=2918528 RepID=UPI001EEC789A|nr:insulinase family protein [Halopseudomonas maritima]UJJ32264.1 insulinase family protein [Halopseudomonas maritima]